MPTRESAGSATTLAIDEVAEAAHALDDGNQDERQQQRYHRYGGQRRRESELDKAENLDGDRHLTRLREEDRQVHVRERMDECEHGPGNDTALDQREHNVAECSPTRRAQARRG